MVQGQIKRCEKSWGKIVSSWMVTEVAWRRWHFRWARECEPDWVVQRREQYRFAFGWSRGGVLSSPSLCCLPSLITVCFLPLRLDHESNRFREAHLLLLLSLTHTRPGNPSLCQTRNTPHAGQSLGRRRRSYILGTCCVPGPMLYTFAFNI